MQLIITAVYTMVITATAVKILVSSGRDVAIIYAGIIGSFTK